MTEPLLADTTLLTRAQSGDGEAFGELTDPFRRELQAHCYRILGSAHDAEDLLQETLLAAWRGIGQFEGRSSLRAWLYRVATNQCLNALRGSKARALAARPGAPAGPGVTGTGPGLPALPALVPVDTLSHAPLPGSAVEREVIGRFTEAFERGDVTTLVSMLTDDAWLTMPPWPLGFRGPAAAAGLLTALVFQGGTLRYRLVPVGANRQQAFACYVSDGTASAATGQGLIVPTLAGNRICGVTRFLDNDLLARFGLPASLP